MWRHRCATERWLVAGGISHINLVWIGWMIRKLQQVPAIQDGRPPQSWKFYFRCNRHYGIWNLGLWLLIQNITFMGLCWRFMGSHLLTALMLKPVWGWNFRSPHFWGVIFDCFGQFGGWTLSLDVVTPQKGTFLLETTSFGILRIRICSAVSTGALRREPEKSHLVRSVWGCAP